MSGYPSLITKRSTVLTQGWNQLVAEFIGSLNTFHPGLTAVGDVVASYLEKPGKFIRPALFLSGYETATGQAATQREVRLALAVEFLHVYLLVHDDIIDQSDTRRGQLSAHELFSKHHRERGLKGDAKRFGRDSAIVLGDALCAWSERIWATEISQAPTPEILQAYQSFVQMKDEVCWGQYLDMYLGYETALQDKETIIRVLREKSGLYSIYRPLQMGAQLGGAPVEQLSWLEPFGGDLGVAFQIVDDILGTFGDEQATGKSTSTDIANHKITLLTHQAFSTASPEERAQLEQFYWEENTAISVESIRAIMEVHAVAEYCRQVALEYADRALALLTTSPLNEDQQAELVEFAQFVLQRDH